MDTYIEFPSVHNTFTTEAYGVFEYGTYPRGTVLEGQERRSCLGEYKTLIEAQADHPGAIWANGSGYREIPIPVNPPEWFDPADAGESWDND